MRSSFPQAGYPEKGSFALGAHHHSRTSTPHSLSGCTKLLQSCSLLLLSVLWPKPCSLVAMTSMAGSHWCDIPHRTPPPSLPSDHTPPSGAGCGAFRPDRRERQPLPLPLGLGKLPPDPKPHLCPTKGQSGEAIALGEGSATSRRQGVRHVQQWRPCNRTPKASLKNNFKHSEWTRNPDPRTSTGCGCPTGNRLRGPDGVCLSI